MSDGHPIQQGKGEEAHTGTTHILNQQVEALVQEEVAAQLARELAVLKESGGIAVKIVGAALALFLAIFTIFGLTTWQEVKKETAEYVKSQAEELIRRNDSGISVKQTLNDLVNRALVGSILVSQKRNDKNEVELSKNDWDRLRAWIKYESLDTAEFSDVLTILDGQRKERKKLDANGFLSEMLSPPKDSAYEWVRKQPDKRLSIMSHFKHPDMGASALEIALSSTTSEDLRLAAVEYIRELDYTDAFDKFIDLISTFDEGRLKKEMLITCAALKPTHPRFVREITRIVADPRPGGQTSTAIQIFLKLWEKTGRYEAESETEEEVMAVSKELLTYMITTGAYFDLQDDDRYYPVLRGPLRQAGEMQQGSSTRVLIWYPTSKTTRSGIHVGPPEKLRQLKPYWGLITDFANAGDLEKVRALLLRKRSFGSSFEKADILTVVTLSETSRIVVSDTSGEKRTRMKDQAAEFRIPPLPRGGSGGITVYWTDKHAGPLAGTLLELSGGGFKFSLQEISDNARSGG